MEFELQRELEYAVRVSADEFQTLIEAHPEIKLLEGSPKRPSRRGDGGSPYYAWRTGPNSFMVTTSGRAVDYGELDPPALTFDFESREAGGSLVHVHGQQALNAWDGATQLSLKATQGLVFWLDRLRWWFSISFFSAGLALAVVSTLPEHVVSTAAAWAIVLAAQLLLVRWHLQNPRVDPARLAWRIEHDALARVTGELITPQLQGEGLESAYRALEAPHPRG
jgi:hypothetical protein